VKLTFIKTICWGLVFILAVVLMLFLAFWIGNIASALLVSFIVLLLAKFLNKWIGSIVIGTSSEES